MYESWTLHQESLTNINYHHQVQDSLMESHNSGVSLQTDAQVHLANLGQVKSRTTFINNQVRLEYLRGSWILWCFLDKWDYIEQLKIESESSALEEKIVPMLVVVIKIHSIKKASLLIRFRFSVAKSTKKKILLKQLDKNVTQHLVKIEEALLQHSFPLAK